MIGYLGLGSNLGDRRARLQQAASQLPLRVLASSSTYDTDPVGEILDQPAFLNACLRIEYDDKSSPELLLETCKAAERALGRTRAGVRHAAREIDIDLLLLGERTVESDRLTLPHQQVLRRRFVLIPLLELDWELRTPDGSLLRDALAALAPSEGVRRAGPPLRVEAGPSRAGEHNERSCS